MKYPKEMYCVLKNAHIRNCFPSSFTGSSFFLDNRINKCCQHIRTLLSSILLEYELKYYLIYFPVFQGVTSGSSSSGPAVGVVAVPVVQRITSAVSEENKIPHIQTSLSNLYCRGMVNLTKTTKISIQISNGASPNIQAMVSKTRLGIFIKIAIQSNDSLAVAYL